MGTHPSGPTRLDDGRFLADLLKENPQLVGKVPSDCPSDDLPYLFKVLSISTALSIQVNISSPMYIMDRYLYSRSTGASM
jgi:mannose-6-phosphate isomerase class I